MIKKKEGGDDKRKGISKENYHSPTQKVEEISKYNRRKIRNQPEMNEENGYWGDKIEEIKNKESTRIGVVNINGIPATNDHRKNTTIRNAVNKYEFDIIGITETNRSWRKVEAKERIRERTRDWWKPLDTMIVYNKEEECKSTALQGGIL